MRQFIDIHILQTLPPSNINRDDTGSPKSAVYGGVPRARVSSQAWKRAARTEFRDLLDPITLGVRTKRIVELVAAAITDHDAEVEDPEALAGEVIKAIGIKIEKPKRGKKTDAAESEEFAQSAYLVFFSAAQIRRLAQIAVTAHRAGTAIDKVAAKAAAQTDNSVDVALFGRMIADAADLNVEAAAQVAHAISVHAVDTEFDYYTAVDDRAPEDNSGAGMIGTIEFNSSTLYRYATVDIAQLHDNLGDDEATVAAVEAFLTAFVKSVPSGKQNTFAHRTLPDAVVVAVRTDQPVNLVTAFENPINAAGSARAAAAAKQLVTRYQSIERSYGDGTAETFVVATGDGYDELAALATPGSFTELTANISARVQAALREPS